MGATEGSLASRALAVGALARELALGLHGGLGELGRGRGIEMHEDVALASSALEMAMMVSAGSDSACSWWVSGPERRALLRAEASEPGLRT